MPTRKELEDQIRRLQEEYEAAAADEDSELWVSHGGTETRLSGANKQKFLSKFLTDLGLVESVSEDTEPTDGKKPAKKNSDAGDPPPASDSGSGPYWIGRKRDTA